MWNQMWNQMWNRIVHQIGQWLPDWPRLPFWPRLPIWRRLLPAIALPVLALTGVAGCSSSPLATTEEMNRAERTIARAEQDRVGQYAASELAEARQKLQASRSALLQRDAVNADRYAVQATLDAELAVARAGLAQANSVNDEMKNSLSILQQEMLRHTQGNQP
ncbi:MAG: DUF4398 domain-containing protein [Rheinheimera sp.]|nr:DUF4398 domain-containing protein [Rheinheimera sp.]